METQIDLVFDYMVDHSYGITSLQAFKKFGITRLSAIIYILRHDLAYFAFHIKDEWITVKTRRGKTRVKRYFL